MNAFINLPKYLFFAWCSNTWKQKNLEWSTLENKTSLFNTLKRKKTPYIVYRLVFIDGRHSLTVADFYLAIVSGQRALQAGDLHYCSLSAIFIIFMIQQEFHPSSILLRLLKNYSILLRLLD
jgi:hypothetical protein